MGKSTSNRNRSTTQSFSTTPNILRSPQLARLTSIQRQLAACATGLGQITSSFMGTQKTGQQKTGQKKQPQRAMAAGQSAQA